MKRERLTKEEKKKIISEVQSFVTELSIIGDMLINMTTNENTIASLTKFFEWAVETNVVSEQTVKSLVILIKSIREGVIKVVELINSILEGLAGEKSTPIFFVRPPEDIIHKQRK
ncbi:MAG: hypothetical protein QW815_00300 [Nitrososphaerota archaeon]